ncbi:MAG: 4-hydroxy-3-methylbut-2-enyl diphosphate reductase [Phycisphaerales bacterium]|nr:MAG: 4-hydroxy-3-methylbut-2-enyl diphosphate reductase [Phycisphaerales bacterium]
MQVKVASSRGFCFGVNDAIKIANEAVEKRGKGQVVSLGPVIHNRQVVSQLEEAGLDQSDDLETIEPAKTILIRSHGAFPGVFAEAKRRGHEIIDATCVLVKHAQDVVKQLHEEGYHVVMIGDRDHPEVRGVIGYAPKVTVIDENTDLAKALPHRGRLGIVAQTTHSPEHVADMIARILRRPYIEAKIVNTSCLEVKRRQDAAVALCEEVEVMFVLGGLHSANTRQMAQLCEGRGCPTFHIETWEQFSPDMVNGKQIAGVAAGASTPESVIKEFVRNLEAI